LLFHHFLSSKAGLLAFAGNLSSIKLNFLERSFAFMSFDLRNDYTFDAARHQRGSSGLVRGA
jgi:hypothetical protein